MAFLRIILQLQILFSFFLFMQTYQLENVHFLISAKLNGTSPAISLDTLKPNQKYLYFLFDFDYHRLHIKNSKNVAFFQVSTNLDIPIGDELAKYEISYRFSQKKWSQIKNMKVANNIMYKKVQILFKEEKDGKYNYYFKINQTDEKKITLIIRVPTQGKTKGFINIYNLLEIPKFQKKRTLLEEID